MVSFSDINIDRGKAYRQTYEQRNTETHTYFQTEYNAKRQTTMKQIDV